MNRDGKIEIRITNERYEMDFERGDYRWGSVLSALVQAIENLVDEVVCENCVSDIKDIKDICNQLRLKSLWLKYKNKEE